MSESSNSSASTISRDVFRRRLYEKYRSKIEVNSSLSRSLVSYQSNRKRPFYRWFKYKEGFSAALVEYALTQLSRKSGRLLDPFAGSGAALFAGRELEWKTDGIELLPVGNFAIQARLAAEAVNVAEFRHDVERIIAGKWKTEEDPSLAYSHLTITEGAFPKSTERDLNRYRTFVRDQISTPHSQHLCNTACFAILESISYTRKDGQYLRWDERSPRSLPGKKFNKGKILSFEEAIIGQLNMMLEDIETPLLFSGGAKKGAIEVREGSCFDLLPEMRASSYDAVVTSPPYCNRYDYTRTYALELAYLGVTQTALKSLRQSLLSCTVENRDKISQLDQIYAKSARKNLWLDARSAFDNQEALQEILEILDGKAKVGDLNNPNIARMVRNYFLESAVVVFEMRRLLKPGGAIVMVNDNVQYAGEEVPVDLILCDFAARAGLRVEHIWTLGRGKGNSSQQMGAHGRNELRKCAYVWRLPKGV